MSDYVKAGEPLRASWANDVVRDLRRNKPSKNKKVIIIGGGGTSGCPFGKIISYKEGEGEAAETKIGIRGGVVSAGDKNFNVPNKEIDLENDGKTLVYLEVSVTANRDDDNQIFLPGIETSSETNPASFWEDDPWVEDPLTQYPDNTPPLLTSGVGKIIIPIGKLTIIDGVANLDAAGCGNIVISQCGGTLSFSRN